LTIKDLIEKAQLEKFSTLKALWEVIPNLVHIGIQTKKFLVVPYLIGAVTSLIK